MDTEIAFHRSDFHVSRRRWPRHKLELSARVVTSRRGKAIAIDATASELNCGGLLLKLKGELNLYLCERLVLEIVTPEGAVLRLSSMVRNRRGNHYGVEFAGRTMDERYVRNLLEAMLDAFREADSTGQGQGIAPAGG